MGSSEAQRTQIASSGARQMTMLGARELLRASLQESAGNPDSIECMKTVTLSPSLSLEPLSHATGQKRIRAPEQGVRGVAYDFHE